VSFSACGPRRWSKRSGWPRTSGTLAMTLQSRLGSTGGRMDLVRQAFWLVPIAEEAAESVAMPSACEPLPAIRHEKHELARCPVEWDRARRKGQAKIEDCCSHFCASCSDRLHRPGRREGQKALDQTRLEDLSDLPGNQPARSHGRLATVTVGRGTTRSRVHGIPAGCTTRQAERIRH
jgi:hypothetical protein